MTTEPPEPPDSSPPSRRIPALRWRRWAPRAVFESVLIVFSVILALGLTNWAEDRRTAHRVEEMRGFVLAEIRANRAVLLDPYYLPHHEAQKRAFGQVGGRPGMDVTPEAVRALTGALFSTGLHPPQLRDAVWFGLSGGELLEHMEAQEIFVLAGVYKAQSELEALTRNVGYDTAVGLMDESVDPGLRVMRMTLFLEDLAFQERALVALYGEAIAALEGDGAAASMRTDDAPASKG